MNTTLTQYDGPYGACHGGEPYRSCKDCEPHMEGHALAIMKFEEMLIWTKNSSDADIEAMIADAECCPRLKVYLGRILKMRKEPKAYRDAALLLQLSNQKQRPFEHTDIHRTRMSELDLTVLLLQVDAINELAKRTSDQGHRP